MDTNSRQNTSKQMHSETKAGGARILTGSHASRARANSAVNTPLHGTAKEQATFISTWKEASHTWRAKAVLCFFLAALLVTMQPSGNALYRTWNPNTGETMGLAVAVDMVTAGLSDSGDQGGGDSSNGLAPGQIISTPDGDESSGDDESNLMAAADETITLKAEGGTFTAGSVTALTSIVITDVPNGTKYSDIAFGAVTKSGTAGTAAYSASGTKISALTFVGSTGYANTGVWKKAGEDFDISSDSNKADAYATLTFAFNALNTQPGDFLAYYPNPQDEGSRPTGKVTFYASVDDRNAPPIKYSPSSGDVRGTDWMYVKSNASEVDPSSPVLIVDDEPLIGNPYVTASTDYADFTEGDSTKATPTLAPSSDNGMFGYWEATNKGYGSGNDALVYAEDGKSAFMTYNGKAGDQKIPYGVYKAVGYEIKGWLIPYMGSLDNRAYSETSVVTKTRASSGTIPFIGNGGGTITRLQIGGTPNTARGASALNPTRWAYKEGTNWDTAKSLSSYMALWNNNAGIYNDVAAYAAWGPRVYRVVGKISGSQVFSTGETNDVAWDGPIELTPSGTALAGYAAGEVSWLVTDGAGNIEADPAPRGMASTGAGGAIKGKLYQLMNPAGLESLKVDPYTQDDKFDGTVYVEPGYEVEFKTTAPGSSGYESQAFLLKDPSSSVSVSVKYANTLDTEECNIPQNGYELSSYCIFPDKGPGFRSAVAAWAAAGNKSYAFIAPADYVAWEKVKTWMKDVAELELSESQDEKTANTENLATFTNDFDEFGSYDEQDEDSTYFQGSDGVYYDVNYLDSGLTGADIAPKADQSAGLSADTSGAKTPAANSANFTKPTKSAGAKDVVIVGWTTDEEYASTVYNESTNPASNNKIAYKPSVSMDVNSSAVYYAVWQEQTDDAKYNLTFKAEGSTVTTEETKQVNSGYALNSTDIPNYTDKNDSDHLSTFKWKVLDGEGNDVTATILGANADLTKDNTLYGITITQDLTFVKVFDDPSFTLTLKAANGGKFTYDDPETDFGDTIVIRNVPKVATDSIGFKVSATEGEYEYVASTDSPTFTFAGLKTVGDANNGYTNTGRWYVGDADSTTEAKTSDTLTANTTLTFKFTQATYTLNLVIGKVPAAGSATADTASGRFNSEAATTITNIPYGTKYSEIGYTTGSVTDGTAEFKKYTTGNTSNIVSATEAALNPNAGDDATGAAGLLGARPLNGGSSWTGSWNVNDDLSGTVESGANDELVSTLTYTYAAGEVGIVYYKAKMYRNPLPASESDRQEKDLSGSTLTAMGNLGGESSHIGHVTTNGANSGNTKLPDVITASTIDNSPNYEVVWVPWNTNTKEYFGDGITNVDTNKFPLLDVTNTGHTSRYANLSDNNTASLTWTKTYPEAGSEDNTYDDYLTAPAYVFKGVPQLARLNIKVDVRDASDTNKYVGYVVDKDGKTLPKQEEGVNSYIVGTVEWGDYISEITPSDLLFNTKGSDTVTEDFLANRIKSTTEGAYDGSKAEWITGENWLGDPASYTDAIESTTKTTFSVSIPKATYSVTVNTMGGDINGEKATTLSGTDNYTFTITDVPYDTQVNAITYNASDHSYNGSTANGTSILSLADGAKTPGTGKTANDAKWTAKVGDGESSEPSTTLSDSLKVTNDTTVNYNFTGSKSITLKVENGTIGSGTNAPSQITITDIPETAKIGTITYKPLEDGATSTTYDATSADRKSLNADLTPSTGYTERTDTNPWKVGTTEYADLAAMANLDVEDNATVTYSYEKAKWTATVSVINPQLTGDDKGDANTTYNGREGNNFTIKDIPYDTAFSDITFKWDGATGTSGTWSTEADALHLNATPATTTNGISGGSWDSNNPAKQPANNTTTYVYTYAEEEYTVAYEVTGGESTWASGIADSKEGYKYGATIGSTSDDNTPASLANGKLASSAYGDYLTPGTGYVKTHNVSDSDVKVKGTWWWKPTSADDTKYALLNGIPQGQEVTQNVTYQYRLDPVYTTTLKLDNDSVAAWSSAADAGKADKAYDTFPDETLSDAKLEKSDFSTMTDAIVAATDYYKGNTAANAASADTLGSWKQEGAAAEPDFDSAPTASAEYTYSFTKVDTITYKIENGKFTGEGSETERSQQLFANTDGQTLIVPGTTPFGGSDTPGAWYKDEETSAASPQPKTGDKSTAGSVTYTYKYEEVKASYTVVPWVQTPTAARSNSVESTAKNETNYTKNGLGFQTVTSDEIVLGSATVKKDTKVTGDKTLEDIIDEWIISNGTEFETTSEGALDDIDFTPTDGNTVINVYLKPVAHTATFVYTYEGESKASDASHFEPADGFPMAKTTNPTESNPQTVYYGEAVTLLTESNINVTLSGETYNNAYTFAGWTTEDQELDSSAHTMGASDLTYTGDWQRASFTLTFHNTDTGAGTIGGKNTADVAVEKKWRETLDEGDYAPSATGSKSFAGWYAGADSDDISEPPTTPIMANGEYWAKWGDTLSITYRAGDNGGFRTKTTTIASGTDVPAFDSDVFVDGDSAVITDTVDTNVTAGYKFDSWSVNGGDSAKVTDESKKSETAPYAGTTSSAIVFTANYVGTDHALTATWNDGNLSDAYKSITGNVSAATESSSVTVKTGDVVPLPTPAQISKFGYTLESYTVTEAGVTYTVDKDGVKYNDGADTLEGAAAWTFPVQAGTADDYEDAITVTANFTVNQHKITYAYSGIDPDSGVDASSVLTEVGKLETPFTVDQSATDASLVDLTGDTYKVEGHTLQSLTYKDKDGTDHTIAAADIASATIPVGQLPDSDVTVTANWAVNTYDVTWQLDGEYASNNNLRLAASNGTSVDGSGIVKKTDKVKYGTSLSTLTAFAPTLTVDGAAVNEYNGTVDWLPAATGTVSDDVVFTGTPQRKSFSVRVFVTHGYFGDNTADTGEKNYGTYDYGTLVNTASSDSVTPPALKDLEVNPADVSYKADPTWELTIDGVKQTGTIADPRAAATTTTVTGAMVYTAQFDKKTYTVKYQLKSSLSDAVLTATEATDKVTYGDTVSGLPSLKWSSDSATGSAADKYEITKWTDENGVEINLDATKGDISTYVDALDKDGNGEIVLTAETAVKNYNFTVNVTGGDVKRKGSEDAAAATYTASVPYGSNIRELLNDLSISATSPTNAKDSSLWTYNDKALDDAYDPAGANPLTGATVVNVKIPAYKTITFDVVNGTWDSSTRQKYSGAGANGSGETANRGTITLYVPETKTLAEYYVTDPATAVSGINTYSEPQGESAGADAGYTNEGTWDKTIVTDAAPTADTTSYTYTFKAREDVPFTVNVYWQNANPSSEPGTKSDYSQDPDQVLVVNGATFNAATPLANLLGEVGADREDGKIEVPTGFVKAFADHSAVTDGVKSDTAITVTTVDSSKNVANVYLDRAEVSYKYEFFGGAPVSTPDEGTARYGETKVLQQYPDPIDEKSFLGWRVKNTDDVIPESGYTFEPAASGDGYAVTEFQGQWGAAVYRATYRLLTESEISSLSGKLGDGFDSDAYDLGATMSFDGIAWDTANNNVRSSSIAGGSDAPVPNVTFSSEDQAQYAVTGWKYSNNGGETWVDTILDSPSKVKVNGNKYVFAPIIQTATYTVRFTGGEYGNPIKEVPNVTVFTLKYGDSLPNSPYVNPSQLNNGYNGTGDPLASNQITSDYAKELGFAISGMLEPTTNNIREWKSKATSSDSGTRRNWETSEEDAKKILDGDKVGGDITFVWSFVKQTYVIHFMNIEGSNLDKSAIDKVAADMGQTTTLDLKGSENNNVWNGGWNGEPNGLSQDERNALGSLTINWSGDYSNIFLNMDKDRYLSALPKSTVDGKTYDPWVYPVKDNAKFTGWVTGSSSAQANATPIAPGTTSIPLSSIAPAENFEGDTSSKNAIFVWATWQYDSANLTFHNGVTGAQMPYMGTAHIDENVVIPPIANMGSDFNPVGYEFQGWYDNAEFTGTSIADNSSYKLTGADNHLYAKYEANKFYVQFKDFNGNEITVQQAKDAGIISDFSESAEGYQEAGSVYTKAYEFGSPASKLDAAMADLVAADGHNANKKTFSKWYYGEAKVENGTVVGSGTLEKDASVASLTSTKGETIVLWPMEAKEYKLTVDTGIEGQTPKSTSKAVELTGDNAGKAVFDLPSAPSNPGYTFGGWTVNGTTYKAGDSVAISNDSNATAVWSAASDTAYTVTRHYQNAVDDTAYAVTADDSGTTGKTGETAKPDAAVPATLPAGVPAGLTADAYELDTTKTTATTAEIKADGSTTIDLYYKIKTFTVTYSYLNAPSGAVPDRTKDQDIAWGTKIELPATDKNLPAGYAPSTGWQEFQGASFVDVAVEPDGKLNVTKDMALFVTIGTAKHQVKFVLGDNADWAEGVPADDRLTQEVTHNANPNMGGLETKAKPAAGDSEDQYVFNGWVSSLTNTVTSLPEPITADVTYTASWRKINAVSYSLGDHAAKEATDAADDEASKTDYTGLPQNFDWSYAGFNLTGGTDADGNPKAEAGWEFDKWVDQDGNTYDSPADIASKLAGKTDQNYTFTATYKTTEQTVKFVTAPGEPGASTAMDESVTKATGQKGTVPAAPAAKPGYEFKGWVGTLDGNDVRLLSGQSFDMPAAPAETTLTAEYERQQVEITYSSADEAMGRVAPASSKVYADDENDVTATALPNPGYVFTKWVSKNSAGKDLSSATTDGTLKVPRNSSNLYEADDYEAQFEAKPYQVQFVNATGDDNHASKFTVNYRNSKDFQEVSRNDSPLIGGAYGIVLDVEAKDGYTFQGWNYTMEKQVLDADGKLITETVTSSTPVSDPSKVTILGDTTFTAAYAADAATVAFVSNSGGVATGTIAPISNKHTGDKVTLPADGFTWPGHSFLGWSTNPAAAEANVLSTENGLNEDGTYTLKGGAEVMYAVWKSTNTKITYHNNADPAAVEWFEANGTGSNGDAAKLLFTALDVKHVDTVPAATATTAKDTGVWADDAKVAAAGYWDKNWDGVPGYISEMADKSKIPGHARKFVGWNTRADGKGITYQAGATIPASAVPASADGNLDLYAMWEDAKFTVTLSSGGGTPKEGSDSIQQKWENVTYGQQITVPAPSTLYTYANHTFAGWQDDATPLAVRRAPEGTATATHNYTFRSDKDVTLTALWNLNQGVVANVTVYFHNMNSVTGESIDPSPVERRTLDDKPLIDARHDNVGELYNLVGWYAAGTTAGTAPNDEWTRNYGLGEQGADGFKFDNSLTVGDIFKKFYNEDQVLNGKNGMSNAPIYYNSQDGDFTADTRDASKTLEIHLYRWAELAKFKVNYHANTPGDAAYTGTMDTQTINYQGTDQKLNANTFATPGYTFKGWVKGTESAHSTSLPETAPGDMLADQADVSGSKALDLISQSEANAGTNTVDLWAVWNPTSSSVKFNLTYDGDGVASGVDGFEGDDFKISDLVWNIGDTSLRNAKVVYPGTPGSADTNGVSYASLKNLKAWSASYPEPNVESADKQYAKYSLAGWYTQPNGKGAKVEFDDDGKSNLTVKQLVELMNNDSATPNPQPNAQGGYDLQLYAQWTDNGATIVYDKNGGTGDDLQPTIAALGSEVGGTTPISLRDNELTKKGHKAVGWSENPDGLLPFTVYNFPNADGGTEKTVYASFTPLDYRVNYSYDGGVEGATATSDKLTSQTLTWNDGTVYPAFTTEPTKEGYTFGGFKVTTPGNKTVEVAQGWDVQTLAERIAQADNVSWNAAQVAANASDTYGTADYKQANGEKEAYELTAIWNAKDYKVNYDLGGGSMKNGSNPNKSNVRYDTADLLIDEADLVYAGHSNVKWYIDEDREIEVSANNGGNPTFGDIVAQMKEKGVEWTSSDTITLYAGWSESKVSIVFKVSDSSIAKFKTVDGETSTLTQVTYTVGASSGIVYNSDGTKLYDSLPAIVAESTDAGYGISGWTLNGAEVSSGDSIHITAPNGDGMYTNATYIAQVEGKSDIDLAIKHHMQAADGTWPDADVRTETKSSADFGAKNGDTIAKDRLVLDPIPDGFTWDEGLAADLVVTPGGTADLYYNRTKHTLDFAVALEDNPSTKPVAPDAKQNVLYGSQQALPTASAAPDGYEFDGWYQDYKDFNDKGTKVDGPVTVTEDTTLTGVYKKISHEVTLEGVFYEDNKPVQFGDAVMTPSPTSTVSVATNATLKDAGYSLNMIQQLTSGNQTEVLGDGTGTKLADVSYKDTLFISWEYTVGDSDTTYYTDDPTKVPITGKTHFKAIASAAQIVMYLPGEHGTFPTNKANGTRVEDLASEEGASYDLSDYLYGSVVPEYKPYAGPVEKEESSDNFGNPTGEAGWKFSGWFVKYTTPAGVTTDTSTWGTDGKDYDDTELSTSTDFKNLTRSITLTANWEPTKSNLVFDLNSPAGSAISFKGEDPSGMYATYDGNESNKIRMPVTDDTDADGWTLSKWVWETTNSSGQPVTYEYEPGSSTFEMPAKNSTETTTLKAVWTEDYVTYNYYSTDTNKGTVTNNPEEVGVWTGKVKGSDEIAKGSVANNASNYEFVKWTIGSADGATVTENATLSPDLLAKDAAGKHVATSYYATFKGESYTVQFKVADGQEKLGDIRNADNDVCTGARATQTVEHNGNVDLKALKAVPSPGNDYADGDYWSYVMYDGHDAANAKRGTATDETLAQMKVTGDMILTANFKEGSGDHTVNWYARNTDDKTAITFTTKSEWNDVVSTTRTVTRTGYNFQGWFSSFKPVDPASITNEASPGSTRLNGQTYGVLAGDQAATDVTKNHIDMYAGWAEKNGYSVEFDTNGSPDQNLVISGLKWSATIGTDRIVRSGWDGADGTQPTWDGHEFAGWYTKDVGGDPVFTDASGETYIDLAEGDDDESKGVKVYAHWTETKYKVHYITNWGDDGKKVYDEVKEYKFEETGLNIASPANDDPNWRWVAEGNASGWYYTAEDGTTIDVDYNTNVKTLIAQKAKMEDGAYIINGTWESKIPYTTTYVLYVGDNESGTWKNWTGDQTLDVIGELGLNLTVTNRDWAKSTVYPDVTSWKNIPIYGFEFGTEAQKLTYEDLNGNKYSSFEDVKVDNFNATDRAEFQVALTVLYPFSLHFDLNDSQDLPGGKVSAELTSGDEGNETVVSNMDELTQENKTFLSINNTPHDPVTGQEDFYNDPTRPGFTFDGWHTLRIDTATDENVDNENDVPSIGQSESTSERPQTKYGDLARKANGDWYEPEVGNDKGGITLYAKWIENQREVKYAVASDQMDLLKIKLTRETSDDAYGTDPLTEVIGAASGQVYVQNSNGDFVKNRNATPGATAKAKRGYSIEWKILTELPGKFREVLGSKAGNATVAEDEVELGAASADESNLSAAATEDSANSSEGVNYSSNNVITPAVDESNLFAGSAPAGTNDAGDGEESVLYVATATLNDKVSITFDKGADDATYTGPASADQPWGTYVGETEPWGDNDGKLPAASTISRDGYDFQGWNVPAGTQYVDKNGNTVTLDKDTVFDPTDENANRIIVPENGLKLTAAWKKHEEPSSSSSSTKPTPGKNTITIPATVNKHTGKPVPETDIVVDDNKKLTPDQINTILNRGGSTPDKWVITYTGPDGNPVTETLSTNELIKWLQNNPITDDVTIAVADDANWSKTVTTVKGGKKSTSSSKSSSSDSSKSALAKTGDNTLYLAFGLSLLALAAAVVIVTARRRQE